MIEQPRKSILVSGLYIIGIVAIADGLSSKRGRLEHNGRQWLRSKKASPLPPEEAISPETKAWDPDYPVDPPAEEFEEASVLSFSSPKNCGLGGHKFLGQPVYSCHNLKKGGPGNSSDLHGNHAAEQNMSRTGDLGDRIGSQRIAGGYDVGPGQFPSFARLHVFKPPFANIRCSGTIISDRLILTAAHCMGTPHKGKPSLFPISAGLAVVGEPGLPRKYDIVKMCRLSGYREIDETPHMDIAVAILDKKLEFNKHVQPACLPSDIPQKRADCIVVGSGNSEDMRFAVKALPVKRKCPTDQDLWDHRLCIESSEEDGDTCNGDSGGPIYCFDTCQGKTRQVSIGSVSYGDEGCEVLKRPSYNANFYNLRHRISELIKNCPKSS